MTESTPGDGHFPTRHRQPYQKTKPAEHHHPSTGPSSSTGTEGQAQSGLKSKAGTDADDVRTTMQASPCQIATPAI